MDHEGPCCRNSNLSPASAEESQSIEAAMSLLLDTNGNYVGDDVAIFCRIIQILVGTLWGLAWMN